MSFLHQGYGWQKDRFEITKLSKAQANKDRGISGMIKRGLDTNGTTVVRGKIMDNNGFICTMAACQDELGWKIDEMVRMVLGYQYIA